MRLLIPLSALLALLSAPVRAQLTVELVLADGSKIAASSGEKVEVAPRVEMAVHDRWFTIRHSGPLRDYRIFKKEWTGEVLYFRSLEVEVPADLAPQGRELNGARPSERPASEGRTWWTLVGPADRKIVDKVFPGSKEHHFLEGGDCLHYLLRPKADPLDELPDEARRQAALALLDLDPAAWDPKLRLDAVLELFGGPFESGAPPPGIRARRDFHWRLFPHNYHSAYGGKRHIDGWYWAADPCWGEGGSNCHYMIDLWPMLSALRHPEAPQARNDLTLGLWMLRQKCGYGLVWSRGTRFCAMWKYEKGQTRRGSSYWPMQTKQWDLPLLVGATISDDPFLKEAVEWRKAWWLRRKTSEVRSMYPGRYGTRALARLLRNLQHFWIYDEENREHYAALAGALIDHAFSFCREGNHFFREPKLYAGSGHRDWAPWMQAQVVAAMHWWQKHEVGTAHRDQLKEVTRSLLELTRPHSDGQHWRIPYHVYGHPRWEVRKWGASTLNAWFSPVFTAASEMGIESVHGVPLEEAAARSRRTAFLRAGRSWSNLLRPSRKGLQIVGGVDGALGSADVKILASTLCGSLR